jgi:hypothetical protein
MRGQKSEEAKVRPGLIDVFIVLALAGAIDIFIFAMATQFINNPVFDKLPSFITDAYSAIWSSAVAGAAGVGAAIAKVLTRKSGSATPNYLCAQWSRSDEAESPQAARIEMNSFCNAAPERSRRKRSR